MTGDFHKKPAKHNDAFLKTIKHINMPTSQQINISIDIFQNINKAILYSSNIKTRFFYTAARLAPPLNIRFSMLADMRRATCVA